MVSGRFTFRIAASALVVLGALRGAALPDPVAAAPAPAGVIIESTAEASYADAGVIRSITSNRSWFSPPDKLIPKLVNPKPEF